MAKRIITCQVADEYVRGAGAVVGAAGSHNDVILRLEFGNLWAGTAKTIIWHDANGQNATATVLTTDLLAPGETEVYLVPIPAEPKAVAGRMSMSIKGAIVSGSKEASATMSAVAWFTVMESGWDENAEAAADITPTQAEQLQAELENIKTGIVEAKAAGAAAAASEAAAAESESAAAASAAAAAASETAAAKRAEDAEENAALAANWQTEAAKSAAQAQAAKDAAEEAADAALTNAQAAQAEARTAAAKAELAESAKTVASGAAQSALDYKNAAQTAAERATAAKTAAAASEAAAQAAQAGAEAAVGKTAYIGENGRWMEWDAAAGAFQDSGVDAQGPQGETGPQGPAGSGSGDMEAATYDPQGYASQMAPLDSPVFTTRISVQGNAEIRGSLRHGNNARTKDNTVSHAEGNWTYAGGLYAHAEGDYTEAKGWAAHAEGLSTKANSKHQHAEGKFNLEDTEGKYAHIVGNGAIDVQGNEVRSNAYTLDWEGNGCFAGKVSAGTEDSPAAPTAANDLTTKAYVDGRKEIFYIAATYSDDDDAYSIDKSYSEIAAAVDAGKLPVVVVEGISRYILYGYGNAGMSFMLVYDTWGGTGSKTAGVSILSIKNGAASAEIKDYELLPTTGGRMTGALTLSGAPTADLHAATKAYVDGVAAAKAPAYSCGTEDLTAGTSPLESGKLYFVYE